VSAAVVLGLALVLAPPAAGPDRAQAPGETTDEAPPPAPRLVDAAIARVAVGPSLREVQDAALRRAGFDPGLAARWLRRARVAAALPTVSVQYDQRLDHGWVLDREVGEADALRRDAGSQAVVRAKATWELDRLVFTPDELKAARAALDLADLRERVLVEVTSLYFERLRLLVERELTPPADLDAAIVSAVRVREIEGLLAGLTGLSFDPSAPYFEGRAPQ
jgi:hypothetical protein